MTAQVELLNFEDYNKRQSNKQVKQINSCKLKWKHWNFEKSSIV